jgi:glycosyltransferase involved in cell wall biosynthesis
MATSLALSTGLVVIAWLWLRFAKREVGFPLWSTLEIQELATDTSPFVSVIVAAGNRADDLERCVQSLLRQDYGRFEVIVVDAISSAATREHLLEMEATAEGTLRVLRGQHSPTEWLSRRASLRQAMEAAQGDWLLFTMAETYHAPNLLTRAMAYARLQGLGMLSLAPRFECRSFWEHVWQPTAFQYLAFLRPLEQVGIAKPHGVWASEAFLMVSREAYAEAGGHAAVSSELHEADHLMRQVKSLGYRVEFVRAMDLLLTRPYRRFRELWDSWSQSLYVRFGGRPLRVGAHAVGISAWAVLPFAALIPAFSFGFWGLDMVHGWWDVVFAVSAILAAVTILQAESVVRRVHRQSHFYTVTLPLGGLCLVAAVLTGCVRKAARRKPPVKDAYRSDTAIIRSRRR